MKRNTLLLATALISAAIAGPVLAQGTAAPQVTTAPTNPGTPGTAITGAPTTGPAMAGPATMAQRMAVTPMDPMKIDHMSLRQGLRTSKVVGMTVVNSANETLGTIDDLIVMPNDTVTYAVLSVGGFLGMGAHYVVVPYANLEPRDKQMWLPNASKESLKALPSYNYPA